MDQHCENCIDIPTVAIHANRQYTCQPEMVMHTDKDNIVEMLYFFACLIDKSLKARTI